MGITEFFRTAAGATDGQPPGFTFQHTEKPTGGSKYPTRVDLTAHHPDTGEQAGQLRYFPPKRRGGPVTVDDLDGHHPGAASALMNEMEARHPGSRVRHANDMPISKEKKFYDHPDYGKPTDWAEHHANLPEQIHRGMSVQLDPSDARSINSGTGSAAEHADTLRQHLTSTGPLGMHWSSNENISRNFSHRNIRDPRTEIPVILHADRPQAKDIETRPSVLKNNGVWAHDYEHGDAEVPMRRGRPMSIRGISWKPDAAHPEADANGWLHHTFDQPVPHTAGLQTQPSPTPLTDAFRTASAGTITRHATAHPGPPPESFARQDGEDWSDHEQRVRRGLSMGHIDYSQALTHANYRGGGDEDTRHDGYGPTPTQPKGWQRLPAELYHTTTDAAGVAAHGLKSGDELGQQKGHGLGGTPQWLSLTDRADHAHNMLNALHEYHDHLNGKTNYADLHRAAQNGEGAQKPYHEAFEYGITGGHNEHGKDSIMRGKRIEPGIATYDEAKERGWTPHPTLHRSFGNDKHDRPIGAGWDRDANVEERHDEYGAFSRARQFDGKGTPSVLFLSNDRQAFAAKDPSNFAVLKVRPKPGAQGFPKSGEHEWRTGTGDAVEVHGDPLRRTSARLGGVVRPFVAAVQTSSSQDGNALKPCPCCSGTGEHDTGSECYHCDGGRTVPADSPDQITCDGRLPDGGHGKTAREFGVFGPPDRWYHASPHDLEEDGFEEGHTKAGADQEYGKHWNSHLGIHLTSHHATAEELAQNTYGTVHHVSWPAQNPKHYTSENELTHEAHDWASAHPSFSRDMPPSNDPEYGQTQNKETALRHHPRIAELAQGFRDHLRSQGHDGITYGNEHEGPRGHVSAIAFSPHDATIDGAHSWNDNEMCEHLSELPPRYASAATPVPDNATPYQHPHDWLPHEHFFAPTKKTLDPRLFDGDRIRPEVRRYLLGLLSSFWGTRYGDSWQSWARVYLAGGAASHFWGDNNDLDVLIGVDYDALNQHCDAFNGEPHAAVSDRLTSELKAHLNDEHRMLPTHDGGESGPWESTFFVIKPGPGGASDDIRRLHPYAAYDLTRDEWAVKPVETGDDFGPEKLPEATWDIVDAVRGLVKAISELPAGVREREGAALYDYLHSDRSAAFGEQGTGLYDPANTTWKALVAAPGEPLQQLIDWKHAAKPQEQETAA